MDKPVRHNVQCVVKAARRNLSMVGFASAVAAACAQPLWAQTAGQQPLVTVQPTPPVAAVERLNRNLTRLSSSPRDVDALVGAGDAAFEMRDVQAARGFYTRANIIDPANVPAKIGLARIAVEMKEPEEAARYFDESEKAGAPIGDSIGDRAFAYDMMGWQDRAQRDYAAALKADPDDKLLRRRYAVSLGISGKVAEAEKLLEPLLYDSDRAAWRDRAFILAMNGRDAEARKITQTVMPKPLAEAIAPYMRQMAALTPAQRAAAVHLGRFPVEQARVAAATPAPSTIAAAVTDARDRRGTSKARPDAKAGQPAENASRAPATRLPDPPVYVPPRDPPPAASTPPAAIQATPAGSAVRPVQPRQPSVQAKAQPDVPAAMQGPPATGTPVAAPPVATPAQTAVQSAPRSLADIIAGIDVPAEERAAAPVVDLAAISREQAEKRKADAAVKARTEAERIKKEAAAKAKAEAAAKAKAEAEEKARLAANPARYWVQIAAGRSTSALAFDLRAFKKKYPDAIGKAQGWHAAYGQTRRLVVGPYATLAKAKAVEADLKAGGSDSFVWRSDAGEEVTRLDGK